MRKLRERMGVSQMELASRAGTDPSVVSRHERGQGMRTEVLESYARASGLSLVCSPAGWDLWEPPTMALLSYGRVPCSEPLDLGEPHAVEVDLATITGGAYDPERCYCLQAEGDSMIDAGIRDGDWVVVDHRRQPQLQQIVVAVVNGGTTVKRLSLHPDTQLWCLAPANRDHRVIELTEYDEVHLRGVCTAVVRAARLL